MNETKRFSLVKPTLDTPFFIDFDWWKEHDNNWRVYLLSYLCPEHQAAFEGSSENIWVDWVDPETAEVRRVDGIQQILITHCARRPEFVTENMTLVNSVFRVLLAHGNEPMTPQQLGEEINRPPETILRTLSAGMRVYKGIRPRQILITWGCSSRWYGKNGGMPFFLLRKGNPLLQPPNLRHTHGHIQAVRQGCYSADTHRKWRAHPIRD